MDTENKKITDYLTQREIKALEKFSDLQLNILGLDGFEELGLISFKYHETDIVNPFVEETGSYSVDPVEYYGDNFLKSNFMKIFE